MRTILTLLTVLTICASARGQAFSIFDPAMQAPPVVSAPRAPTPNILWWECNDVFGTNIASTVGVSGVTTGGFGTGVAGGCLTFAGFQAARSADSVVYGTNKITVTFWYKRASGSVGSIIAESSPNWTSYGHSWLISHYPTLNVTVGIHGTSGTRHENCSALPAGEWVHIAAMIDNSTPSGDVRIITNGVEALTVIGSNSKSDYNDLASYALYIGARNAGSDFFTGSIDDIRVYRGLLSNDEINLIRTDPK